MLHYLLIKILASLKKEELIPDLNVCKIFDESDLEKLKHYAQRLMAYDYSMFERLSDPRLKGLRAWEYGLLLAFLKRSGDIRNWNLLDVGPGRSILPAFMAEMTETVTTLDYESPLEKPTEYTQAKLKESRISSHQGSMLALPFENEKFDLVTCISVIEHLDDMGEGKQTSYEEFIKRTKTGLSEMIRVIKRGGYLYLTTDAYILQMQKEVDQWSKKRRPGNVIWSAYKYPEIQEVFLNMVDQGGLKLVGKPEYDRELLISDSKRSCYRGRYFTTFAILGRK